MPVLELLLERDDHDFLGNDEHTVALGRLTASREGRTLDATLTEVCHWRDGQIVATTGSRSSSVRAVTSSPSA